MLGALGAWHPGMQVAVVLGEVQMPPGLVRKVVSWAGLAAFRTGVKGTSLGLHIKLQPMGQHGHIQVLVPEGAGCLQTQAEGWNLGAVHAIPPVVVEGIYWPSSGGNSIPNVEEPQKGGEACKPKGGRPISDRAAPDQRASRLPARVLSLHARDLAGCGGSGNLSDCSEIPHPQWRKRSAVTSLTLGCGMDSAGRAAAPGLIPIAN